MQSSLDPADGKEAKRRREDADVTVVVSKTSNSHGAETKVKVKSEVRSVTTNSRDYLARLKGCHVILWNDNTVIQELRDGQKSVNGAQSRHFELYWPLTKITFKLKET